MRFRALVIICALFLVPFTSRSAQGSKGDGVIHGTVNIALGNQNGLVLLTDSMVTAGDQQLTQPGEKLFKLDDWTVCSIAGFASAPAASNQSSIPDLNANISAIIHEYVRQSPPGARQSIAERLNTLAFLINQSLTALANVRDVLGNTSDSLQDYRFQLIVAGYEAENKPEIGKVTLRMAKYPSGFRSEIEDVKIVAVKKPLTYVLNGIPDIAERLLEHPESGPGDDHVISEYGAAFAQNEGRTLTVDQMTELAKRLAYYTSRNYRQVGGPNQLAVFKQSETGPHLNIEQPTFPEPPRPLFRFTLMVSVNISGYNAIRFDPRSVAHIVCVRCSWSNVQRKLDGNYYIGNQFDGSVLTYDGGPVNLGNTNRVRDCILLVGPDVKRGDTTLRQLIDAFQWADVRSAPWQVVPWETPQ